MDSERNKPNQNPKDSGDRGDKPRTNGWVALTIAILIVLAVSTIYNAVSKGQYTEKTWSDFRSEMAAGNLSEVDLYYDRVIYLTREEAAKSPREQKACFTGLPSTTTLMELADELVDMVVTDRKSVV